MTGVAGADGAGAVLPLLEVEPPEVETELLELTEISIELLPPALLPLALLISAGVTSV